MNQREKTVVVFLIAVFLFGAGVATYKKLRVRSILSHHPVAVEQPSEMVVRGIDINRATAAELEVLPGIGPVLAQRIVAYRERKGGFKKVEELLEVSGIGPKRFAAIKDYVICEPRGAGDTETVIR